MRDSSLRFVARDDFVTCEKRILWVAFSQRTGRIVVFGEDRQGPLCRPFLHASPVLTRTPPGKIFRGGPGKPSEPHSGQTPRTHPGQALYLFYRERQTCCDMVRVGVTSSCLCKKSEGAV